MDDQDKNTTEEQTTNIDIPQIEEPTNAVVEETNNTELSSSDSAEPSSTTPAASEASENVLEDVALSKDEETNTTEAEPQPDTTNTQAEPEEETAEPASDLSSKGRWYVVHTYSGHENKVVANLKQKIESEHLEHKIFDILVPTQDKIEIRSGKKEQVKEKIFPGYILVNMDLDDISWLAVRTTPGVTSFVGIGNKPTPISTQEVKSIVQFMNQGAAPTFKDVFLVNDTVKIIDGPFAEFIGKVDSVDKERGKVRVLVSIFGRETPVELDFLQVAKL